MECFDRRVDWFPFADPTRRALRDTTNQEMERNLPATQLLDAEGPCQRNVLELTQVC